MISTSNGWSFGYDANGNMNSYKGNTLGWTSYNLPSTITAAGQSSQFSYGPNRNRWRQIATYPSGTETTIYVGGILEKVTVPSGTAYRHSIGAGSAQVLYTRWTTGTINTKYVTSDHLGSSTVVMDGAGGSLVNLSFGSYGARRGSNWTGTPSAGDWTQISNATRHGFTGHEALDNLNFVHMNGRVFEPVLGRFLSADPFTPGILGSQAPNRYAYVGNRPHFFTDPSGFDPDDDVTETEPPPRYFPQCPYQMPNIAVDCPFNYGWRWFEQSADDLWMREEYRVEAWVRWRTAAGATVANQPLPPPTPGPPAPRPSPGLDPPQAPESQPPCVLSPPTGNYTTAPGEDARFNTETAEMLSSALVNLNQQGVTPVITSGYRSLEYQAALRSSNSPTVITPARVSWHQAGAAVDFGPNSNAGNFDSIRAAMTQAGFVWGGSFNTPDRPHFQSQPRGTLPSAALIQSCARAAAGG